jgi:hypothetical protein
MSISVPAMPLISAKKIAVYIWFNTPGNKKPCMVSHFTTLLVAGLAVMALLVAGCTTSSPGSPPAITVTATPAATAPTPMNAMQCNVPADCVPAQCCHPTSCINKVAQKSCDGIACTMMCSGPLDCGAGSCGCVEGQCSVMPATIEPVAVKPMVRLEATPQRYSPIMSSTPGIAFSVNTSGITPATTTFSWTTGYGQFLSWNPPNYTVNQLGDSATSHGETVYWSFIDKPASTAKPVMVTVVAKDTASGKELGRSTATLAWDGDYAVRVQDIS